MFTFNWWITLLILGVIFMPMSSMIFKKFVDKGWVFSKIIGFAVSGITVWYLSYAKILKYTKVNCYFIIGVFFIINALIYMKNKEKINININKEKISKFLIAELIFSSVFFVHTYFRSFTPTVDFTTEKFMNYGFMNALFNAEYMPAEDIWFSGYSINYYYFGQYISSFITKISNLQVPEGFNLAVAMINTFTFIMPFEIGYNLGIHLIKEDKRKASKFVPTSIGLLAAIAVSIGGSLYYPIYNFIVDRNGEEYYYWEDTRYIGYRPDTNDQTINETLPYSNLVGDLHAHHIDTMFVFLTLALLLQMLLDDEEKESKEAILNLNIILLGITLGIQKMTNYWDFPIYLVVIGITIIFNNFMKYKFGKEFFKYTLAQIGTIVLIDEFVTLPFTLDLHMSATKVFLTHVTSPFYKLMVLWGLPTICILLYILDLIIEFSLKKESCKNLLELIIKILKTDIEWFPIICIALYIINLIIGFSVILSTKYNNIYKICKIMNIILQVIFITYLIIKIIKIQKKDKPFSQFLDYVTKISKTDMFVFIIGCCAIGLMVIPEIIYVKDIYDDINKRANTMYKLCYQADIMFEISTCYILIRFLYNGKWLKRITGTLLLAALISTFGYGINGLMYNTNKLNRLNVKSLSDTEGYLRDFYPNQYNAIQWIKENIPNDKIILERSSGSYTLHSHISVFAGNPTVLGWHGHEWIWRADEDYTTPDEEDVRWGDIYTAYVSHNVDEVKDIIDKYGISYIYVCNSDINEYLIENLETLKQIGDVVYEYIDEFNVNNSIYIIKVRE